MPESTSKKKTTTNRNSALKSTKKTTTAEKRTKPARTLASSANFTKTEEEVKQTSSANRIFRVKRSYFWIVLVLLLLIAVVFLVRNYLIAASVNGQMISRYSVIKELERQGGKQTLDAIVTKTLITQEAKKRNVNITPSDVDAELKRINDNLSKQGQKLDQVLALQGMSKDQLVEQIKLQKMIEKMVGSTGVTDKDVNDYITNNKESLPQDLDEKTLKVQVRQRLEQQKLNEKAQTFVENLRKTAKIDYYIKY